MLDRAFKVGEKVRVIQSRADARSNTARAPGWTWRGAEAQRCGHSGVIDEATAKAYPDPGAGYQIKFPDGDRQSYVQSNQHGDLFRRKAVSVTENYFWLRLE